MDKQKCTSCGNDKFEELIVTINQGVSVEEDGFADCTGESSYPEPTYTCEKCGAVHEISDGTLLAADSAAA